MSRRWLFSLVAVALAMPAVSQEQRAALEGTVRDVSGGVVAEADVAVLNTAGTRLTATTDRAGVYRFPAVPPGRWNVTASAPSFQTAQLDGVRLALGQLLQVDLVLEIGALTEEVVVSGEAPLVDVRRSARFTNIRDESIEKLPSGRDYTSLVAQAPGANWERKSGGLSIDGATVGENRYMIDGMETSYLWFGWPGLPVVTDFVEEVQVKSSGFAAEYGGATGGVVNVLTKSGTNRWRGAAWTYLRSDALGYPIPHHPLDSSFSPAYADGRPSLRLVPDDPSRAEYVTYPKDGVSVWEPGFSLGGPLVRDKLWFFASYNPALRSQERTVTRLADGSVVSRRHELATHHGIANVSARLGAQTQARVAFNLGREVFDGNLPRLDGFDAADTLYEYRHIEPNWSLSGNVDHVVSDRLFVSLRGGYHFTDFYTEGVPQADQYNFGTSNLGMAGVPEALQQANGFRNIPSNYEYRHERPTRLSFQGDATWFATAAGEHAIKAGVLYNRIAEFVDSGNSGNIVDLFWDRAFAGQRGTFGYYGLISNDIDPERGLLDYGDVRTDNWALFLQDSWTIANRLTLNLGLRAEREKVPSFAIDPDIPTTAIDFSFKEKLAPRVGFAWDVKGDGRMKLHGSWGVFHDVTKIAMPFFVFGGRHGHFYAYTLDTPEWPTLADAPGCPPACPGDLIVGPFGFYTAANDPANNQIDPDIQPYRLQEATVGIERALNPNLSITARYVHKQLDRVVETIGARTPNGDSAFAIGNPGFGRAAIAHVFAEGGTVAYPQARREYDAVELTVNKRLSHRWSLRGSYTWSRLWGNYSGLAFGDGNGSAFANTTPAFDNPAMMFDERAEPVYGPLPADRPHQLKAQFVREFDFGTSVGFNGTLASGTAVTRMVWFFQPSFPVPYLGRGSDGRTPTFSQLDLNLQHAIRLGGEKSLQIQLNVLNLFDQSTAISRYPQQLEFGAAVGTTEDQFFRGIDTRALIEEQGLVEDPRFLMDSEYQSPREVRLGIRFSF